jgi:hypothetical protein
MNPMTRADLVNFFSDRIEQAKYLEIGVHKGETFFSVRAAQKVAVDPHFAFEGSDLRLMPNCIFHETYSDRYFSEFAAGEVFDIIFVDGLHTFEQTLRDFLSAGQILSRSGVIIIDDVHPDGYFETLSIEERAAFAAFPIVHTTGWAGDVYRLRFFIEMFMPFWYCATPLEARNQMICFPLRKPRTIVTHGMKSLESVARSSYSDFLQSRLSGVDIPLQQIEKTWSSRDC